MAQVEVEMECVNLKERFGSRFKVRYEESYQAQYGARAHTVDPWLMVIPCHRGHVCPWGGDMLAASIDSRGSTAKKLVALPGVRLCQDGFDGVTVVFPLWMFDHVAELMRPRRRRVVSEEGRTRLAQLSREYSPFRITEKHFDERQCVPMLQDDPEAIPA